MNVDKQIAFAFVADNSQLAAKSEQAAQSLKNVAGAQREVNVAASTASKTNAEYGVQLDKTGRKIKESSEKLSGVVRILGEANPAIAQMVSGFGGLASLLGGGGPVIIAVAAAVAAFSKLKSALSDAEKARADFYVSVSGAAFDAAESAADELRKVKEEIRTFDFSGIAKREEELTNRRAAAETKLTEIQKDRSAAENVLSLLLSGNKTALEQNTAIIERGKAALQKYAEVFAFTGTEQDKYRMGVAVLRQAEKAHNAEIKNLTGAMYKLGELQQLQIDKDKNAAAAKTELSTATLVVYEADLKASTLMKGLVEQMSDEGQLLRSMPSLFSPYTSAIVTANRALFEHWQLLSMISGLPPTAGMAPISTTALAAQGMDTGEPFRVDDYRRDYREVPADMITQLGVTGMEGYGAPMQDLGSILPGAAGTAVSGAGAALAGGGGIAAAITAAAAAVGPGIIAAAVAAAATGFATIATAPFLVTGAIIGGLIQKGAIDALAGIPQAIMDAVLADDPAKSIGDYFINAVTNIEKMATNLDPVLIKVVGMLPTFIEKLGTAAISMLITTLTEAPYIVNSLIVGFGRLLTIVFENLPTLLQVAIPALVQGLGMLFVAAIASFPPVTLVLIGTTIAVGITHALIGMDWGKMLAGLGNVLADTFISIAAAIVAPLNAWIGSVESAINATGLSITLPRIPTPQRAGWIEEGGAAGWAGGGGDQGDGTGTGGVTGPAYRSDIPWFHGGGWAGAMRAHRGMLVGGRGLGPNEVPLIAERGERVLSRDEVSNMGGPASVDRKAQGAAGGGNTWILNFLTPAAADQFINETLIPALIRAGQTGYLTASGLRFGTP